MKVFYHHIYEYLKGLRNLILHTTDISNYDLVVNKLEKDKIDFVIYPISENKINIFFGNTNCVEVVRRIGKSKLNEYSVEEDFMLGIMLGYDRVKQCERYLKKVSRIGKVNSILECVG